MYLLDDYSNLECNVISASSGACFTASVRSNGDDLIGPWNDPTRYGEATEQQSAPLNGL
jgi:hypothetical protein